MLSFQSLIFSANFAFVLISVPFFIRIAKKRNLVDIPNSRSSHSTPTPRGGGVFITLGCILSILAFSLQYDQSPMNWGVLASFLIVSSTGFLDDIFELSSSTRLWTHILAALTLISCANLGETPIQFTVIAFAASIWLVGSLNIYNFLDGIDGIASCQGIAAALTWSIIALSSDSHLSATIALSLLGGLVAFLFYNWSPAAVFMGDSASGLLGFAFAALPLVYSQENPSNAWFCMNIMAISLFPFLFDGSYTLFRRLLRKENLLKAHRSHLYQRWNQSGKTHRFVTTAYALWAILCGSSCLLAFFALLPLWVAWISACLPAAMLLNKSRRFPK